MARTALTLVALVSAAAASAAASASAATAPPGVYGLNQQLQLSRVFPNGTSLPVGPPHSSYDAAQQLSCIDGDTGVLYFIGYDRSAAAPTLVGLDLTTGAQVSAVALPFAEAQDEGLGQLVAWEPASKRVIVGGAVNATTHVVGLIDPVAGAFAPVAYLTDFRNVFGAASVYVPTRRVFLFDLDVDLVILDLDKGTFVAVPQNASWGLLGLNFDKATGDVYGLAGGPGEGVRTVVRLDPTVMNVTITGYVPDWANQSGGITAYDSYARAMFWIAQKAGAAPGDPFYLVSVSVDGGKVLTVSSGPLCTTDAACPWSLHWYGGPA
jgi:hypothetical protein